MVRHDETLIAKATTPSAASPQPPLQYQEGSYLSLILCGKHTYCSGSTGKLV